MLNASTATCSGKGAMRPAITPFLALPDGQFVEVEFDPDENAVEISHLEACGAVSGSVFIPVDQVSNLIKQLRRAIPK
jgi:hypothetical protein